MVLHDDEGVSGEPIRIDNAGLILTSPFLPQWFHTLGMLERTDEGKTRIIPDQVSRAVHLLQSVVGASPGAPESLLSVNKLLCGVPLSTPIERAIEPTTRELEACNALLKAMLANWTIISSTSIQGLQETLLQREGCLEHTPGGWRLLVQRTRVDVLIDYVPWNISTIVHAWMPEPILVTW